VCRAVSIPGLPYSVKGLHFGPSQAGALAD